MTLVELVQSMTPEQRAGAIAALDHCTTPLTARQIETVLRERGHSKSFATTVASALKPLNIITIHGSIK